MLKIIDTPHLPQGKLRYLIIGKKYEKMLKNASLEHDFELICADDNPYADKRLIGHIDLIAAHLGKNRLAMQRYCEGSEADKRLRELGIETIFVPNSALASYPHDATLNFCVVGDTLIYNSKTANNDIVNKLTIKQRVDCRQGYTKCSACVVDEKSIITEDKGIASAAGAAGLNVLCIENSGVKLEGFDKGFIGGAAFKLAPNAMAFTGYIINNDVRAEIESFLNEREIEAVYLNDCPAFDIGSAIPIVEKYDHKAK